MANINDPVNGAYAMTVDSFGSGTVKLYDNAGNPVALPTDSAPNTVAGMVNMGLNDRSILPVRLDRTGGIATSLHDQLLTDSFENTTINPDRYLITNTTMAATQASATGILFNSGAITTINTGYMLQSAKRYLKAQKKPLCIRIRARLNYITNSVMELGFGNAATFNGVNTTGAYFQVTTSGVVQPVLTYNSVDTTGTAITISTSSYYTFDIMVDDDFVTFTVQDTSTGLIISKQVMKMALTAPRFFSDTQLPVLMRLYNSGSAPPSAPSMIVTDLYVYNLDITKTRPWPHAQAAQGRGTLVLPSTGAQLATWTNSAEPASATLANATAGYTTLGGKFQFAAVAGAATDYALFGWQCPSPLNFVVTGVSISTWNIGAAVATTPTLLTWAIAAGSTAVSLATATVARIGLGSQSLPIGAAVGANSTEIVRAFQTPIHVGSARFLHIILRMPVGTATASQVIAGMVNIEGYFE